MQTVRELATAVHASYQTPPGSLRHFARFGAVALGVAAGIISVSNNVSAKEAALRAAIAERDAKITELMSTNTKLEKAASGEGDGKVSSGDMVQDWVDSLSE